MSTINEQAQAFVKKLIDRQEAASAAHMGTHGMTAASWRGRVGAYSDVIEMLRAEVWEDVDPSTEEIRAAWTKLNESNWTQKSVDEFESVLNPKPKPKVYTVLFSQPDGPKDFHREWRVLSQPLSSSINGTYDQMAERVRQALLSDGSDGVPCSYRIVEVPNG